MLQLPGAVLLIGSAPFVYWGVSNYCALTEVFLLPRIQLYSLHRLSCLLLPYDYRHDYFLVSSMLKLSSLKPSKYTRWILASIGRFVTLAWEQSVCFLVCGQSCKKSVTFLGQVSKSGFFNRGPRPPLGATERFSGSTSRAFVCSSSAEILQSLSATVKLKLRHFYWLAGGSQVLRVFGKGEKQTMKSWEPLV